MIARPGIELPHEPFWASRFAVQGFWSRAMKIGCWLTSRMLFTLAKNFTPRWGSTSPRRFQTQNGSFL